MDANERRYWEDSPKGLEPRGRWEWSYAAGSWHFYVEDELVLELSDAGLCEFRGRVPAEESFIEVFEGTFINSIVLRRIELEKPAILRFLRERGLEIENGTDET